MTGQCKNWVPLRLLAFLRWSQNDCQQTKFHLPSQQEKEGKVQAVLVTLRKWTLLESYCPKVYYLDPCSLYKEGWESKLFYPLEASWHVRGYWKSVVAQPRISQPYKQTFLSQVILCFGGNPVHWRTFSSIPSLYPCGTGSPLPPQL